MKRPASVSRLRSMAPKRPAASIESAVCDDTSIVSMACSECQRYPRPGHVLHFGYDQKLLCSCCLQLWKRDGGVPLSLEVIPRAPKSFQEMLPQRLFILPSFFTHELDALGIFNELGSSNADWKAMHGSLASHRMHLNESKSQSVMKVAFALGRAFHLEVDHTRVNLYGPEEYKPLHHDKHAFDKSDDCDIWTAAASFGSSRTLTLANPVVGNTIGFSIESGDAYAFGPLVNKAFVHGIPKSLECQDSDHFRLSVVVWGRCRSEAPS